MAYVGANGEERTILYAGAGTLMNVPTIIAGDIKNTVVTCTERVEAAIFDAGLLTDRAFAAAHPDLLLNLIHSLCIHLVIHSQHLGDASLVGTMGHVCRVFQEMSQKYGGRPRFSPDMTQQELAALLGIHRTTLTRILCRLKALNIIEKYTKNDLHILDMEALDRLARGDKR
ncbi:Crp/Fnr family transcriptional regulator [Bilophila wadsworthia]|uniref:Crp/Fnr family transcriptional regulator n=1 Tax=Bilophila wadsworthia TaxID=35833 RepID=UPI002A7ED31E|nr:Crp/Fnr family transcriptional regulator [Bilophila wadsworthia]MDY3681411.1 Crp/Fnr family transcriptional regulator [Bilophila wadsworthia]